MIRCIPANELLDGIEPAVVTDVGQAMLAVLVDYLDGITFGMLASRLPTPIAKSGSLLRVLASLVRDGRVISWKSKPQIFRRYRIAPREWIVEAAKKEGVA